MCGVYLYNKGLAKKLKSSALIAAAKDNLSDAVTSLVRQSPLLQHPSTSRLLTILQLLSLPPSFLKTAYDIFMEATFSLSDRFQIERNLKGL